MYSVQAKSKTCAYSGMYICKYTFSQLGPKLLCLQLSFFFTLSDWADFREFSFFFSLSLWDHSPFLLSGRFLAMPPSPFSRFFFFFFFSFLFALLWWWWWWWFIPGLGALTSSYYIHDHSYVYMHVTIPFFFLAFQKSNPQKLIRKKKKKKKKILAAPEIITFTHSHIIYTYTHTYIQ